MPGFVGFWELIALAAVLLLLFGPRRLPEVGRSLGRSIREFKDSLTTPLDADGVIEAEPLPEPRQAAPRRSAMPRAGRNAGRRRR